MSTQPMGRDSHIGTSPPQTPSRCSGVFLFYHDQRTNTHGYHIHGFNFSPPQHKGFTLNQKRLGPLPKKAHKTSENDTSPSASSHMDASHSSRDLKMPDSELTRLGSALPSRIFLSYENCPTILGHWIDKHQEPHM